jgi:hypothetical protein
MVLFIRRFSKLMSKQKFFKGINKDKLKSKTKSTCYNYGKYDHYIANCPYEHRKEDDDKKKKKEKSYKKDKHYKKKAYDEAHNGKEWDSDDESSNSDSDDVATVRIKGSSYSSKSLFSNLNEGKHTCLMANESKKKVKSNSAPPKYVSSDDEIDLSDEEDEETLLNDMCKNPKERMNELLKGIGIRDELLDQQEKLLIQERETNQELKKLLKLEKEKNETLDQELAESNETKSSLQSSSGALQDSYNVLQKTHNDLEV